MRASTRGSRTSSWSGSRGESLAERIREDRRPPASVATRVLWVAAIARALEYAHGEGVVHRDVKPSNIRITAEGRALLVDFGLVRTDETLASTITRSFAGTPDFASPEQINGSHDVGPASDVYALGVTLYWALSSKKPFTGASMEKLFHKILEGEPIPLRTAGPNVPKDLALVVHKAMARSIDRRYRTAGAFADDLENLLALRPVSARPLPRSIVLRRFLNRHIKVASGLAVIAIALIALFADRWGRRVREARSARWTANELVSEAKAAVDDYRDGNARIADLTDSIVGLQRRLENSFIPPEEVSVLDAGEVELANLRHGFDTAYHSVIKRLERAIELHPEVEGVEEIRASLYLERFKVAVAANDRAAIRIYRSLALDALGDGPLPPEYTELHSAGGAIELTSEPPGAKVHVFRMYDELSLVEGGEPRKVATPGPGQSECGGSPGNATRGVGTPRAPRRGRDRGRGLHRARRRPRHRSRRDRDGGSASCAKI